MISADVNTCDRKLAAFRTRYAQAPDNRKIAARLAELLTQKEAYTEALAVCTATAVLPLPDGTTMANQALLAVAWGNAALASEQVELAVDRYAEAVALCPQEPRWHNNLANALRQLPNLDAAQAHYRTALDLDPSYQRARFSLGCLQLAQGKTNAGWDGYETRLSLHGASLPAALTGWDGSPDLRPLVLHAEQGLGDTLMFCRFAALAARRLGGEGTGAEGPPGRVVLRAPARLCRLLRTVPGLAAVVPDTAPLDRDALHLPLGSLPQRLGIEAEQLCPRVPYIGIEPDRRAKWARALPPAPVRVGVIWQGSPNRAAEPGRSYPLSALTPLAAIPGVRLLSLQHLDGLEQWDPAIMLEQPPAPIDLDDGFVDTAALMSLCDLIITPDTATAHLAGALGRSVWIGLKRAPDWRWGLDDERSLWYPTARLVRQPSRGDWTSVMARMAADLETLASAIGKHAP
jgi:tetratricopeptide (TPR) repeat protein